MSPFIGFVVAGVTTIAVVAPFVIERVGPFGFEVKEERVSGSQTARTIVLASILLAIVCFGVYAAFMNGAANRYGLALGGSFIALLLLTVVLPSGRIRAFGYKLLGYSLVLIGILWVVQCLANLWIAATDGRVSLRKWGLLQRTIWIRAEQDPTGFWFYVGGYALLAFILLCFLREYFLTVRERRISKQHGS